VIVVAEITRREVDQGLPILDHDGLDYNGFDYHGRSIVLGVERCSFCQPAANRLGRSGRASSLSGGH
jgi:hypothetical protein